MFELAGKLGPERDRAIADDIPEPVLRCVDSIAGPAYILDRYWTARSWNRLAARLFVGWLDDDADRNLLRFLFLNPVSRQLVCDWEERARRVIFEFRATVSLHASDPGLRGLVGELGAASPAFATIWGTQGVVEREGGERTFNHPTDGFGRYQQISLTISGWPDFRLTMLIPADRAA